MISTTVRPRVVQKGLICQVFIGLKKEISDRRRADDQLIMKPFFFLCLKEKVRLSLRMDQSRHLIPLYKHEQVFFWKGLIIIFLVYVELLVSWLLLGESGRSFHLSLPFGCGSISDRSHVRASLHDFTRVLFLRFNSHEVYSAINGTF